jgi:hypothetical protein
MQAFRPQPPAATPKRQQPPLLAILAMFWGLISYARAAAHQAELSAAATLDPLRTR